MLTSFVCFFSNPTYLFGTLDLQIDVRTGAYTLSGRRMVATWTARMRKTGLKTVVDRMINLEITEALI